MLRQAVVDDLDMIDRQHRFLHEAMGRMQEAIAEGRSMSEINDRKRAVLLQSDAHMEFEESLMAKYGYPLADIHTAQHQSCRDQITTVLGSDCGAHRKFKDAASLVKTIHGHHGKYFDEVFCFYLIGKHFFENGHSLGFSKSTDHSGMLAGSNEGSRHALPYHG